MGTLLTVVGGCGRGEALVFSRCQRSKASVSVMVAMNQLLTRHVMTGVIVPAPRNRRTGLVMTAIRKLPRKRPSGGSNRRTQGELGCAAGAVARSGSVGSTWIVAP